MIWVFDSKYIQKSIPQSFGILGKSLRKNFRKSHIRESDSTDGISALQSQRWDKKAWHTFPTSFLKKMKEKTLIEVRLYSPSYYNLYIPNHRYYYNLGMTIKNYTT